MYTINAIDLAIEIGMGKRTNTILQSAFFKLAKVMPEEEAIGYMKDAATHSYLVLHVPDHGEALDDVGGHVAGHEVGLVDIVGGADGLVAEGHPARQRVRRL